MPSPSRYASRAAATVAVPRRSGSIPSRTSNQRSRATWCSPSSTASVASAWFSSTVDAVAVGDRDELGQALGAQQPALVGARHAERELGGRHSRAASMLEGAAQQPKVAGGMTFHLGGEPFVEPSARLRIGLLEDRLGDQIVAGPEAGSVLDRQRPIHQLGSGLPHPLVAPAEDAGKLLARHRSAADGQRREQRRDVVSRALQAAEHERRRGGRIGPGAPCGLGRQRLDPERRALCCGPQALGLVGREVRAQGGSHSGSVATLESREVMRAEGVRAEQLCERVAGGRGLRRRP